MFNKLEEIIKKVSGNVLVIELDDELLKYFDKNNNINLYSLSTKSIGSSKDKNRLFFNDKKISIKKLKKYIKKNSFNVLICNMNKMVKYYKYFIKDSIYINNKDIYLYFDNEIDKDLIISKYKRYNVTVSETKYKNGYILKIDNTNGKNNKILDLIYFISDTMSNIADIIGNIMIS